MYICIYCGHHFDEPHNRYNRRWSDSDDSVQYCPNCGSEDIEEAGHCIKCGDYFPIDEMIGSICKECVEKRATRANAYLYAIASDYEDISRIDEMSDKQIEAFCLEDKYDFSEWLEGQENDVE